MVSHAKKEQKAQRKLNAAQNLEQMIENIARIPSHRAITVKVDGHKVELKVDLNFKKTSDLCIVGTMGAYPDCLDISIIRILGHYKDYATDVRVAIFFGTLADEKKIRHRQVRYFQALRDCLNTFKYIGNGNLRFGAKTIDGFQWLQLRNLVYFYELDIPDWEFHIGYDVFHKDKDGKKWTESVWKAVLPGWEWDKRYLSWLKVVQDRELIAAETKALLEEKKMLQMEKNKLAEVNELERVKEKVTPINGGRGKKKRSSRKNRRGGNKKAAAAATGSS